MPNRRDSSAEHNAPPSPAKPLPPRRWVKLGMTLAGLVFGVVAGPIAAGAFVASTYSCNAAPCDAGGYVGAGLTMLLIPLFGAVFAVLGYKFALRHEKRRAWSSRMSAPPTFRESA